MCARVCADVCARVYFLIIRFSRKRTHTAKREQPTLSDASCPPTLSFVQVTAACYRLRLRTATHRFEGRLLGFRDEHLTPATVQGICSPSESPPLALPLAFLSPYDLVNDPRRVHGSSPTLFSAVSPSLSSYHDNNATVGVSYVVSCAPADKKAADEEAAAATADKKAAAAAANGGFGVGSPGLIGPRSQGASKARARFRTRGLGPVSCGPVSSSYGKKRSKASPQGSTQFLLPPRGSRDLGEARLVPLVLQGPQGLGPQETLPTDVQAQAVASTPTPPPPTLNLFKRKASLVGKVATLGKNKAGLSGNFEGNPEAVSQDETPGGDPGGDQTHKVGLSLGFGGSGGALYPTESARGGPVDMPDPGGLPGGALGGAFEEADRGFFLGVTEVGGSGGAVLVSCGGSGEVRQASSFKRETGMSATSEVMPEKGHSLSGTPTSCLAKGSYTILLRSDVLTLVPHARLPHARRLANAAATLLAWLVTMRDADADTRQEEARGDVPTPAATACEHLGLPLSLPSAPDALRAFADAQEILGHAAAASEAAVVFSANLAGARARLKVKRGGKGLWP